MRIYLFLADKIVDFVLPLEIMGSFSFDENPDEESKLINIEARDNQWVLYSTVDSTVVVNNNNVTNALLVENNFYVINRENKNYLIYVSSLVETNLKAYTYAEQLNLVIGNSNECNINYSCPFLNGIVAQITYKDNQIVLTKNNNNV